MKRLSYILLALIVLSSFALAIQMEITKFEDYNNPFSISFFAPDNKTFYINLSIFTNLVNFTYDVNSGPTQVKLIDNFADSFINPILWVNKTLIDYPAFQEAYVIEEENRLKLYSSDNTTAGLSTATIILKIELTNKSIEFYWDYIGIDNDVAGSFPYMKIQIVNITNCSPLTSTNCLGGQTGELHDFHGTDGNITIINQKINITVTETQAILRVGSDDYSVGVGTFKEKYLRFVVQTDRIGIGGSYYNKANMSLINISYNSSYLSTAADYQASLNPQVVNNYIGAGCNCADCVLAGDICQYPVYLYSATAGDSNVTILNSTYEYGVYPCSVGAPFNYTIMNITYFNENTLAGISASSQYLLDISSPFSQSLGGSFSSASYHSFCTNVNLTQRGITYSMDGSMAVSSSGYDSKIIENDIGTSYILETNPFYVLPVYLTEEGNSSQVTFTIKNYATKSIITNVLAEMYQYTNGTPILVNSKLSDVTGKIVFDYIEDKQYLINFSHPNYNTLTATFNPISTSTYDILMVPTTQINNSESMTRVSINFTPSVYVEGDNNFSIRFYSPYSELQTYSYYLEYPSGYVTGSGTTAGGQIFNQNLTIINPSTFDLVTLIINYSTPLVGHQSRTYYFEIDSTPGNYTMMQNKDKTYGLGIFERMFIAVFIMLLFMGIATLVGQPIGGLFITFIIGGYLVYIGFLPIWSILIGIFAGIIILSGRSD